MSRIRGSNTKPEVLVRSALHALGFRFRLHDRRLPGTPDIVLRRHRAVIFVNGCFWHGHGCKYSKMPNTRAEFWRQKISRTKARDTAAIEQLLNLGWNVIVVWECSLRGRDQVARNSAWTSIRTALAKRHPTISEVVPLH